MARVLIAFVCLFFAGHVSLLSEAKVPQVTCGSTVKLLHVRKNVRLHSHEVSYGSGSGQQSVTGVEESDDVNSYWTVRGAMGDPTCKRGVAIKCGGRLRLQHLSTNKNLHSHLFQSPLSQNYEVSAFGDNGKGDTGDNWIVLCSGKTWRRDSKVQFKHEDTDKYLYVSGQTYNHPIAGQYEVSAYHSTSPDTQWKVAESILIKPTEKPEKS